MAGGLQASTVNDKYVTFRNIFYYYFDQCFPYINKKRSNPGRGKIITPEIRQWSARVRDLYLLYRNTGCPEVLDLYKHERKIFGAFLEDCRRKLNEHKICASDNKSRAIWSIYRGLTNANTRNTSMKLTVDDGVITDPIEIANAFANSTHSGQTSSIFEGYKSFFTVNDSLFLYPTDFREIYTILLQTQRSKSASMDDIPPAIVAKVAKLLVAPLEHIVNECFICGCFPDDAKIARVVPLHKKGKRDDIQNYRTLSVLPAFSKVIEKVIYNRLMDFLAKHHIISPSHYGFLPRLSTEEAIFNSINSIIDRLDQHQKVAGVYFDLSRAFDTLQHKVLLCKIETLGIRGKALELIESYLTNRKHSVSVTAVVNGVERRLYSEYVNISQGVPQGSILGPILFLLYVNDLHLSLDCPVVCQYADDTSCVVGASSVPALSYQVTKIVEQMNSWCSRNNLSLNINKTALIHYKRQSVNYSLYVPTSGGSVIEVDHTKFLGVIIDSQLLWTDHIDNLVKKLNSSCCAIRWVKGVLTLHAVKVYYFAHIQAALEYGIIFWGSSTQIDRVFKMQKRVIRSMLGLNSRTSCRPYFRDLRVLTVPSLYIYKLAIYCRKNNSEFVKNREGYRGMHMTTRGCETLRTPFYSQSRSQSGAYFRAVKVYNRLPGEIRRDSAMLTFKQRLKVYLIESCFYSFDEYIACDS